VTDLRSRWAALFAIPLLISIFITVGLQDLQAAQISRRARFQRVTISSPSLQWGNVQVGSSSTLTDTISNLTSSDVTINSATFTGSDFTIASPAVPFTIATGKSATLSIMYAPATVGSNSDSLVLSTDSAATPSLTIALAGTGFLPGQLSVSPSSFSFGTVKVGASQTATGTLVNGGGTNVTISQAAVSGAGFTMNGMNLPLTLRPGQSANFTIAFTPTQSGAQSGSVSIIGATLMAAVSNNRRFRPNVGTPVSLTVPLSGAGTAAQIVSTLNSSPSALSFGNVQAGKTQTLTETLTNSGSSSIVLSEAVASGNGFSVLGPSLPITLAGGQSANFNVTFAPQSAGSASGSIAVASTASNSSFNVALSGTGVAAGALTVSPASLSFGSVQTGENQKLSATISNTGGSTVTISQAKVSGTGFTMSSMTTPMTVAAGQSASVNITFAPQSAGSATGSLAITSDATDPSVALPLSGTGVTAGALTSTSPSLSFGTVQTGNNQTLSETLTNSGGSSVTISQIAASGNGFSLNGVASLPLVLSSGQTTSFSVKFAPQSAGSATGTLAITSDASNSSLNVPLSGSGVTQGALTLTSSSLSFGSVQTGTTQTLSESVTNSGGSSVTISQIAASGTGFSLSGVASLPLVLSAGQTTSFSVKFAPQSASSATGSLAITSDASNSSLSVPLSGSGVTQGALTPASSSLSFGTVQTGNTQTLSETLTNSGGSSVTISQIAASGTSFSLSGVASLPLVLSAGQTTSFSVKFAPQSAGSATGTVAITSDASNSSLSVPLSGSGATQGALTAASSSLSFGTVQTGNTQTLSESVTNSGGSSVTISQIAASGTGFSLSGVATLPLVLSSGQTTSFSVKFAPPSAGSATGSVVVSSNASNASLNVSLSGTGQAPGNLSPSPASMSFGNVQVSNSKLQSETLTNSGGASVTISQASISGSIFTLSGLTLPMTLAPGQSFTFGVTFAPQTSGSSSGNLLITSDAPVANLTISLTGSGTVPAQLSVSPATLSFGSVTVGSSQQMTGTLTATGSSVTVSSITPSTSEFSISGVSLPVTITAGHTANFTVTFTPQTSGLANASLSFSSDATNTVAEVLAGSGAAAPIQHSVDLSWSASTSSVSGYNVYRSTTSGTGYSKINSALTPTTSYTDNSVLAGTTYYYVTTAVDASGHESGYSNQVQAVVPTP
jgi:Cep192 domain 4/Abnormal spindle-like microcephaly-assoc'd, ASPM-SPD-2-Hydin/HYDIN/CFA65/VesB-like, Ig-like domain